MSDVIVPYLQIFGIGFSFGLAGPCLLTCAPVVLAYSAGSLRGPARSLLDAAIFLTGRLFAYVVLGFAAGFSAEMLKRVTGPSITPAFKFAGGAVSIMLGLSMLLRSRKKCACGPASGFRYGPGGIFLMGFTLGAVPCAPLSALLFEIALISKGALGGAMLAFFFGAGTFLSGILFVGTVTAGLSGVMNKAVRSVTARLISTVVCAFLLIIFGSGLIIGEILE